MRFKSKSTRQKDGYFNTYNISIAIGSVISSFSAKGFERLAIFVVSGLAAAIPDLDVVSLWSEFDNSIGKLFGLSRSGKEIYFQNCGILIMDFCIRYVQVY